MVPANRLVPRRGKVPNVVPLHVLRGGRSLTRGLLSGRGHRRRRGQQPALKTCRPHIRPLSPLQGQTNARLFGALVTLEGQRHRSSRAKPAFLHENPPCVSSPADSAPPSNPPAVVGPLCIDSTPICNNAIVPSAPGAPVDVPLVPTVPNMHGPHSKVPLLKPQTPFFLSLSLFCMCVPRTLQASIPNRPPCFPPLHFHSSFTPSGLAFFCRCLPARLVAEPPR